MIQWISVLIQKFILVNIEKKNRQKSTLKIYKKN